MKIFTLTALLTASTMLASAQLIDAGFELGAENSSWDQTSTNYGTPLCTVAGCGTGGGPCVPQAGTWYAWFGGATVLEEGSLSQGFVIPSGTSASLSFYKKIATPGDSSETQKVDVKLDGNILYTAHCGEGEDADYIQQTIDISSYADGGFHYLDLESFSADGMLTNILFDTFNLVVDGNNQVSVNELLNREMEISFYPNPVVDQLTIRFNGQMSGSANVSIVDLNGKIVTTEQLNNIYNGTFSFNAAVLANGIYNVVIEHQGQRFSERIVVAH